MSKWWHEPGCECGNCWQAPRARPTAPDPVGEARDVAPSWDMLRREVAALRAENERINKDRDDWRKGYALIASALGIKDTLSAVALAEVALNLRAALERAYADNDGMRDRLDEVERERDEAIEAGRALWLAAKAVLGYDGKGQRITLGESEALANGLYGAVCAYETCAAAIVAKGKG